MRGALLAAAAALVACVAGTAYAHGPVRQKTEQPVEVNVPAGIAMAPDGSRAYVTCPDGKALAVIDAAAGKRRYVVALARGVGFVTDQYSGATAVFHLDTLEEVKRVSVGDYPEGIEASSDGRHISGVNWASNTVSVIDSERLAVEREIEVGDGPRAFGMFLRQVAGP